MCKWLLWAIPHTFISATLIMQLYLLLPLCSEFIHMLDHKFCIYKVIMRCTKKKKTSSVATPLGIAALWLLLWSLTEEYNITNVTLCTGCLSGCWPRKYFTWGVEATDRCLSSNTAFIKASPGCEDWGRLCLYPPAAIKTAKSQEWEELAEAVSQTWPR